MLWPSDISHSADELCCFFCLATFEAQMISSFIWDTVISQKSTVHFS
jgi:hypothetical protein